MIRGLIFDLGDTLIRLRTGEDWAQIRPRMIAGLVAYLRSEAGLEFDAAGFGATLLEQLDEYNRLRQSSYVEYSGRQLLAAVFARLALPWPSAAEVDAALAAFYGASEQLWEPMPQLHSVLQAIAATGPKMALISNAMDAASIQRLIDAFDLRRYFDPIVVSAAAGIRKPDPRIFQPVLDGWQLPPGEVVMIGDTLEADVLGARSVGLQSVWLTTQAQRPDNLAYVAQVTPDATAESLAALPEVLRALDGR